MNRPEPESLSDRILILLKDRGALKAVEIAEALHCVHPLLNQALYGALAGRVSQDKSYRWMATTPEVKLLRHIVLEQNFEGSIGLVCPFREQANRIRELVNAEVALSDKLARMEFTSETAHQFQGDERDVTIFSPVVSQGITQGSVGFLRKNGNLFNVATTRARAALYVVGDTVAARKSGIAYLANFAHYVDEIQVSERVRSELKETVVLGSEYPPVAKPELVSE